MLLAKPDFDIGIIGGGPAGAGLASYLAKEGIKCVVLERELFPRPHVGESLVPSSTRVFKDLNFLPTMEEYKFPHKYGAVWTAAGSNQIYNHGWEGLEPDCYADVRFEERNQPGVEQNYTYHVDRGLFDLLLLQHANKLGAEVYEGIGVRDIEMPSNGSKGFPKIKFKIGNKESSVSVRMIADASGRKTFLGNRLKLKIKDPVFDQYAIHSWFEGFDRSASNNKEDFINIHFLPITNSWVWQIPITNSITSIGVVTQKKNFAKSKDSREKFFWDAVASNPLIYNKLRAARQMRPFSDEGDYSYAMTQITGDGWAMVGDAGRFVDPIFSTGVSIALNSARFLKSDILNAMETGNFARNAFSNYQETLKRGTRNWYNFISVYYRLNCLFTAFIMDPRYRIDVLKLLQGDVYDEEEPEVLTKMRAIVTEVEENKSHVWHKALGDLTANAFKVALCQFFWILSF